MRKISSPLVVVLLVIFHTGTSFSQDYRIRNFGSRQGISHPFVYTINQDSKGYIWVGTGEGLCRFNGFEFNTDIKQDSLAREVVGTSYKDNDGTLWFGYYSGDIARYCHSRFETMKTEVEIKSAITGFTEFDKDNLLAGTLNHGLLILNKASGKAVKLKGTEGIMCTALLVVNNFLLLGNPDGLSLFNLDRPGKKAGLQLNIKELEFSKIQDIQQSRDGRSFWIGTEDQGVFRLTLSEDRYSIEKTGALYGLEKENVQSVFEDSEKQLWISTQRNGVFKLGSLDGSGKFATVSHLSKENGLPGNSIKKIFEDLEGNIWIATYGEGVSLLSGQAFSFISYNIKGLDNDIQSVAVTPEGMVFLGGNQGLFSYRQGDEKPPERIAGIPAERISALAIADQNVLVGTENGLYMLSIRSFVVRRIDYEANSLGNSVNSITVDQAGIYLGTKDGIYRFDKDLRETGHFTTSEGLPHNNIENVFIDSHKRVLFATRTNGIYELNAKDTVVNTLPAGKSEIEFKSIAEDGNGGIWAATYGDGVFMFKNDSVYHFTMSQGLKSDYCYSIIGSSNQSLWIGHRMGLSRINTVNLRVSKYDINLGFEGDCNPNAVCIDKSGVLFFGTTEGLVTYNPAKESKRKLPPFTNITKVLISDKIYDPEQKITLPYKAYRLRIDFIGLNYRDPASVLYQYKLAGHDLDWSDVTDQTFASYPRIDDGEYIFLLRSYNSDGLTMDAPISVRIKIKPPFWKTWWFLSLSVVTLFLSVFLYVKIRERKQKQLQEYLETELAARTKEVVEQKEVIEIKNRDITDSINYAKRIQNSMLPPVKRLQQYFSGYFVFYHPRDIVSGDFYWFDQVNENKFVVVCADSTGHGVPGAFMSMIGSTLIKDICTRANGNSPSAILKVLDCELRNTLNQNLEDGSNPGDGMDIIVCEIDLKTHYVRYASAMRPMIIYRNGEEIFVKGSRNSVGGHYDREENVFEDEGLQLSKGDIIYMFSDGYSDQFGGPMGKKFKMVRLKNLLTEIHQKPMDEQFTQIKGTFDQWMENFDQVDDVLFMGIKI
jgi:ligand-binding sensor domain-containing protein/serine phosphatase RsbU (regulator of sigma subunit)